MGSPPYARYTPDLDVFPQNFAIAQDARGIVYVGNSDGVMEFDGERWSLIPLPNHDIVRSLAVDEAGRVYVGGYNAMGYLQRDHAGLDHYVDLTPRFADVIKGREFADIWDVLVAPEGVYFRAVRDVFLWQPHDGEVRSWHHEDRFGAITRYRDTTLLQFRGEALKRRDGEGWTALPGPALADPVFRLVPLHDGGLLALGANDAWRRVELDQVTPLDMPAGMPPSSSFQSGAALDDGSIALAGKSGLLYIVDPQRRGERHFQLDPGFLSDLRATADGGFLVCANQAVYRVAWPTPWSVLGSEHGLIGTTERLAHWNGEDFVLTSAGVTRLHPNAGGTPRFEPLPAWSSQISYDLHGLDAHRALIATSHKLVLVEDGKARDLSDELIYPRAFFPSRFRPQRIYLGTELGLRSLDLRGPDIVLSPANRDDAQIRVASLVEVSATELWFGTERHGIWRVRLDADGGVVELARVGPERGLADGTGRDAQVLQDEGGRLLASTSAGFSRWDGARFVPDDLGGLAALRGKDEDFHVELGPGGEAWAYSVNRLMHRPRGGAWREEPVRALRRGAYATQDFDADGRVAFATSQSLVLYDPAQAPRPHPPPQVLLRSVVQVLADGTRQPLPLAPETPVELPQGDYGLQFQFALPDLAQERGRQYQGRLVGYESAFSDWSGVRGYTYSRLSPGTYSLEVRARDSAGHVTQTPPYTVVVLSPWYLRWWAQGLWAVLAAAAVGAATQAAIRRRTERLAGDKQRLETLVAARTQELALANQRLLTMASVDGLTGIANRRRLDEYLDAVWTQAQERGRPIAVLLIDVDHFKRYNDTHGHLAGDQLLKDLVGHLSRCLRRAEDLLARYGGEEFLAVLPGADTATAAQVAEAMRRHLAEAQLGTTVSIGVASRVPSPGDALADLIGAADEALYAAKDGGRDRVVA